MENYAILRDLAIILFAAKFCGMVSRKFKAPQVAGQIIAGLLIGPACLGLIEPSDFILKTAEVGVILVMFSAGLEILSERRRCKVFAHDCATWT